MGRKNVLNSYTMFDAVPVTAQIYSEPVNVTYMDNCGILIFAEDINGTLYVQISNDRTNPTVWTDLDFGSDIDLVFSGYQDSSVININQMPFNWVRLFFDPAASDVGSLTCILTAKML